MSDYQRAYRESNKASIADYQRAYRESNKASIAEKKRAYRESNKASIAEKQRAYYESNKASDRPVFPAASEILSGPKSEHGSRFWISRGCRCEACKGALSKATG